jgi:S-adenosylmethionine/arginine decarboxylase-like enzyme
MWGKHAALNLYRCSVPLIRCPNNIIAFSDAMVRRIDMKAYGRPMVQHFGEGNKTGYTLVQLIETSNITGHFCDETGDAYLDIFSCKDFNTGVVETVCREFFRPQNIDTHVFERTARPRCGWDCP